MADFVFFMHNDAVAEEGEWQPYLRRLQQKGVFQGGSAIGEGICLRKNGAPASITTHLAGFIRVTADGLDEAKSLLTGNPVFEAGGTIEVRELPRTE